MSKDIVKSEPRRRSRSAGIIFAFFAGIALLIAVGTAAFWFIAIRPVASVGDKVADALAKITGGQVTVSGGSAVLQDKEVSELAVVNRRVQSVVKYESDILGSSDVLIVKGEFDVKAGYKLDDPRHPAQLSFDPITGAVSADFPPARVLSVEMRDYEVLFAKQGFWNKLTPEDQQHVTRLLILQARKDADASDLREEAEMRLLTRLDDLLSSPEVDLRVPILP